VFSSRRRHTRSKRDWSSDVCSSDLDAVFMTKEQKHAFIVKEVKERHGKGQPILIGTTSILQSEDIAKVLEKEQLEFELLNAKSRSEERRVGKECRKRRKK